MDLSELEAVSPEAARAAFAALAPFASGEVSAVAAFALGVIAAVDDPEWAAGVKADFAARLASALPAAEPDPSRGSVNPCG